MSIPSDQSEPVQRSSSETQFFSEDSDLDETTDSSRVEEVAREAITHAHAGAERIESPRHVRLTNRHRSRSHHRTKIKDGAGARRVTRSRSTPVLPMTTDEPVMKIKSSKVKFFPQISHFLKTAFAALELPELINVEGIYREGVDGNFPIDDLAKQIKKGKSLQLIFREQSLERDKRSAILISSLIKKVIREHVHSLIPYDLLLSRFPEGLRDLQKEEIIERMQHLYASLHETRQEPFKELLEHLIRVEDASEHNLMTSHNLAITVAPAIFELHNSEKKNLTDEDRLQMLKNIELINNLLEECIDYTKEQGGVSWLESGDPKAEQ